MPKHIIMVNLTTYELKPIAGKRGIKNYENMSREKLFSTLDESEHIFENLSQNGLKQIAKMQNLSQNELKQIMKMQNLSQNELEQIAKKQSIKKYKNMSKEELLISLLKSKQSHAELYKSKSNNAGIEDTKKNFSEIRSKFKKSRVKEIRKEKRLENENEKEKEQHAEELQKIKNF